MVTGTTVSQTCGGCGNCDNCGDTPVSICELADVFEITNNDNFQIILRQKFITPDECGCDVVTCRGVGFPLQDFVDEYITAIAQQAVDDYLLTICYKDFILDPAYVVNNILVRTNLTNPGNSVAVQDLIDISALTTIPTCATKAIIRASVQAFSSVTTVGNTKIASANVTYEGSIRQVAGAIVSNSGASPGDYTRDSDISFFYADLLMDNVVLDTIVDNLDNGGEGWAVNYSLMGFLAPG